LHYTQRITRVQTADTLFIVRSRRESFIIVTSGVREMLSNVSTET